MPKHSGSTVSAMGWGVGASVLASIPGASEAVVDVLVAGAEVEVGWAGVLAALSGSDAVSATILLGKIRNISEKEKAVLAVAEKNLPPEFFEVLTISALTLRPHRNRRNAFAHSSWGESPALPGAVFLVSPERMIRFNMEFWKPPSVLDITSVFDVAIEDVYRAETFEEARLEALQARSVAGHLHMYFRGRAAESKGNVGPGFQNYHLEALRGLTSYQASEAEFLKRRLSRNREADT